MSTTSMSSGMPLRLTSLSGCSPSERYFGYLVENVHGPPVSAMMTPERKSTYSAEATARSARSAARSETFESDKKVRKCCMGQTSRGIGRETPCGSR
eukprot:4308941-Pleurochrysis_carterae.AAC.3